MFTNPESQSVSKLTREGWLLVLLGFTLAAIVSAETPPHADCLKSALV